MPAIKTKAIAMVCAMTILCGSTFSTAVLSGCNQDKVPTVSSTSDETIFVEETVAENKVNAVEEAKLTVDDDGNITDENGNKVETNENGNVEVKTEDGKTVEVSTDEIKAVNDGTNTVVKQSSNSGSSGNSNSKSNSNSSSANSSSSGGSSSSGNSSGGSSSSSSSSSRKTYHEAVTKQVWVEPVTKQIWVEAVTHEETTYEKKARAICNDCGADITDWSDYDQKIHMRDHLIEGGIGAYHIEYKNVAVGTTTVVDKEGYYKTETVTEGYYKTETVKEGYYKTETVKEGYYKTVVVKEAGWY